MMIMVSGLLFCQPCSYLIAIAISHLVRRAVFIVAV